MVRNRTLKILLIFVASAASASSQIVQSKFVWDNSLVNCGTNNGAISCLITHTDHRQLTFKHKEITLSMSHGWSTEDLRVIVTVENSGDTSVPVDARGWTLTTYKSVEDLIAERDPTRTSPAKKPYAAMNNSGMLNTSTIGLPSSAPVERVVTRGQTTNPSTGQILNPSTKVISNNPTASHTVISSPGTRSGGAKRLSSATKWTEVAAHSTQIGEVRFPYDRGTIYVSVSFNINGTNYVYRLAKR